MSSAEGAGNKGTPSSEGPSPGPIGSILTTEGHTKIAARRFTKEDLHAIERELHSGPFDEVRWTISDEQGTHKGQDLSTILARVLWETVTKFDVVADRYFYDRGDLVQSFPPNRLSILLLWGIRVSWSSRPEHRQPVEFAYKKVVRLLENLPKRRGDHCAFVEQAITGDIADAISGDMADAEQEPRTQERPWWDPRRAPQSISDWLLITAIGGIAVGVILALIFLAF